MTTDKVLQGSLGRLIAVVKNPNESIISDFDAGLDKERRRFASQRKLRRGETCQTGEAGGTCCKERKVITI